MQLIGFKSLFIALALGTGVPAHAVPVMNENGSLSAHVTLFPDHADANLFYLAPNFLNVCKDENGTPRFLYQDMMGIWGNYGITQMTLCAQYNQAELEAARAAILARNPNARFTPLPFVESRVVFNPVLSPFVDEQFCNHRSGQVGDEQTCSFRLNSRGRQVFLKQARDRVALTMQFEYVVEGFIRTPDGTFAARKTEYGVAVRIGGEGLDKSPELFRDARGNPLRLR